MGAPHPLLIGIPIRVYRFPIPLNEGNEGSEGSIVPHSLTFLTYTSLEK